MGNIESIFVVPSNVSRFIESTDREFESHKKLLDAKKQCGGVLRSELQWSGILKSISATPINAENPPRL